MEKAGMPTVLSGNKAKYSDRSGFPLPNVAFAEATRASSSSAPLLIFFHGL
jgi:hypothetical protein